MTQHHMTETHTTQHETLHPEGWAPARGYANGVVARGRQVFIAGQIGWDPTSGQFVHTDFVGQVEQTLRNIVAVLRSGGAEPKHLVRLTWFITDKAAYMSSQREIGRVYREIIGRHFPAMSVVFVSALVEDAAQVEIEATAVIPETDTAELKTPTTGSLK
jgi:enamine deaminase RidA (YjgF/YER057c/UK114 family)